MNVKYYRPFHGRYFPCTDDTQCSRHNSLRQQPFSYLGRDFHCSRKFIFRTFLSQNIFFSWEGKQKFVFLSCGTEIHFSIKTIQYTGNIYHGMGDNILHSWQVRNNRILRIKTVYFNNMVFILGPGIVFRDWTIYP
jgi:hypothetical protein